MTVCSVFGGIDDDRAALECELFHDDPDRS